MSTRDQLDLVDGTPGGARPDGRRDLHEPAAPRLRRPATAACRCGTTAIERAIELNGVSVDTNKAAFRWGRLLAHEPARLDAVTATGREAVPETVDGLVADREARLVAYQDRAYAARYCAVVQRVAAAERERAPGHEELTEAVARNLYKLMAYKDEYEVARLYTDPAFAARLEREFDGDFRFKVNLAPQRLNRRDRRTDRTRKWEIPSSLAMPAFHVLARTRRLRGTRFDLFGGTAHRQAERARIARYEALVDELIEKLRPDAHGLAVQLASLPDSDPRLRHGEGRVCGRRRAEGGATPRRAPLDGGVARRLTLSNRTTPATAQFPPPASRDAGSGMSESRSTP